MAIKRTCIPSNKDKITHKIYISGFCPVSNNPLEGSYIKIVYKPSSGIVLDVDIIALELQKYKQGHENGVRNAEEMLQELTNFCCNQIKASVKLKACLIVQTKPQSNQTLEVVCKRDFQSRGKLITKNSS